MTNTNSSLTLQGLLTERVSVFALGDRPREIIDAHVESMFKEVIKDAFRSYGDLGKAVSAAIKEAMPGNIEGMFELTRYNTLIANALREQWLNSGVEADMVRRANEALAAAIKESEIPSRVSLRELLEGFIEQHKEEATREQWEAPVIQFEESDCGYLHIYFDEEPESQSSNYALRQKERSVHQLKNAIHVSFHDKEQDDKGNQVGRVYSAMIDENPIGKDFSIHNRWEQLLAGLYFGAAKLVIDCDADDFSYGLYD